MDRNFKCKDVEGNTGKKMGAVGGTCMELFNVDCSASPLAPDLGAVPRSTWLDGWGCNLIVGSSSKEPSAFCCCFVYLLSQTSNQCIVQYYYCTIILKLFYW